MTVMEVGTDHPWSGGTMSAWLASQEAVELRRRFDEDEEYEDDGFSFDDEDEEDYDDDEEYDEEDEEGDVEEQEDFEEDELGLGDDDER